MPLIVELLEELEDEAEAKADGSWWEDDDEEGPPDLVERGDFYVGGGDCV